KRRLSMCVGCGSQIHDQFILRVAPDLEWHAACLKCADCHQFLDETCTCFVRDGKTYCKRDYIRLFGTKCSKCALGFQKNDFVMRARNKIYHVDCFRCVACSRQLIPGDEFALREDGLFCKADHDVVERAQAGDASALSPASDSRCSLTPLGDEYVSDDTTSPKIRKKKRSHHTGNGHAPDPLHNNNNNNHSHTNSNGHGGGRRGGHGKPEKTTRVRTVLNEKQLHTLRTCYNANPRPDALMKEQLTEMTQLSPRVIRVWFQNKRCKDKKRQILMKSLQDQKGQDGRRLAALGSMQGVPMVASSPVRHESSLQANPIDVQQYQQPPWQALSEFAMKSDLDQSQPPFQQLMHGFGDEHHNRT
ncbi:PREDICTED: insulin gene enhancer protein ISL-1-like, partial [Priapulus caudatus]|uniref:Insulin gene enhancer protein ISL-1-like n=1 Tax=Priapulus caudatus TaxID=37621 RepID=A0ABM1EY73_PRICU